MCDFKKVPIEGYTHVYRHDWESVTRGQQTEYVHGAVRETLDELNDVAWCYEYPITTHKHVGVAKIKIELIEGEQ